MNVKIVIMAAVMMGVGTLVVLNRGGASFCCPSVSHLHAPIAANERMYDNPSGLPRLVELGSTTCIPCQIMKPIIEELTADYAGSLDVVFVDVVTHENEAKKYTIEGIPTQVFVSPSGKELHRHEGILSKADILAKWTELGFNLQTQINTDINE